MLNFKFLGFQIDNMNYFHTTDSNISSNDSDTLTFNMGYDIEHAKECATNSRVRLKILIKKPVLNNRVLNIDITVSGFFDFEDCEEYSEKELDNILKYDGIAILFPYVRTLIQNISSYDCSNSRIILPRLQSVLLYTRRG